MSTDSLEVRPLTATIGAEIFGVDLTQPLDDSSRDAIHRGLHLRPFTESGFESENAAVDSRGQVAQAHSRARLAADQYWRSLGDAASRDYSRYADHLFTIQKRLLADEHGIEWRSPLDVEH